MKNKILESAQRCSIYTHIFYGYVIAWKIYKPNSPIKKIAEEFIKDHDLYDDTDWKTLQMNYSNFTKKERDLKRDKNKI